MATVNWSLQHKRDKAANWTSNNPTLLEGQLGIETDNLTTTPKFKIGDGVTDWNTLPYFYGGAASAQNLNNVLSVGNTTNGNNIVMSGTDVISDSTGTNMFVDLNATTIYSTDGYNRMAFTADISGKTSEISVRDYSVISLEKGYVRAGITDIYSGVISQSAGWYNQIHTNLNHIEVQSNWANFRGIEYLNDWSANYSLRSLVDKGYIINNFVPYTGATSDVDLATFLLSTRSIRVTGTAGSGDIHLRHQSTDATATGQSTSLFADVNGNIKWKNDGNYYTTLKTSNNTGDRIYTYPDADGTIALTSNIGTWGALNYPTWVSGTPFVKMTAAGTFALDTNTYQPLDADLTSWASVTRASGFDTFTATPSSANLKSLVTDETGSGALVFGTSPTFTTDITTPKVNGVTNALTINAATTLLDEMYLGTSASRGIWSWNASTVIFRSGSSAANMTIGTPAYTANIVSYNATGNVAIGGVADNATDQLQVSNHIGTPVLNLRGRSGAAPTVINFYPFDSTNSVINFRNISGTIRGFIDLNVSSGEMKFWGSSGGYFPTFGSNGSERMRIDINGNVVVNTAAIATNATNGFLYIPSCAGTPTGVPTAFTGRVPMVYDSTNNKFYIYNGAWKSVTLA